MSDKRIPVKTELGHAELARRALRLGPRHRTLLLLVDGQRNAGEVRRLGEAAGVPAGVWHELLQQGLVDWASSRPRHDDDSLLPAARTLLPDPVSSAASTSSSARLALTTQPALEDPRAAARDEPLEQARGLLLGTLQREAPLAGAFIALRLRRAGSRAELLALLDEVAQRLRKPRRPVQAEQALRQARHLLSLPPL